MFTDSTRALRILLETGSVKRFERLLQPTIRSRFLQSRTTTVEGESVDLVRLDAEALESVSGRYLTPLCAAWPSKVEKPGLLRVMGHLHLKRTCAVVGTRRSSHEGLHRARELARLLMAAGYTLVSGGALGVDINALRAANEAGGSTITVLGSGLLYPTPNQHHALYRSFLERGAIISSFRCHQKGTRWTFAKRNEWIAAMADVCVVIEGNTRSGALMAARHALKMGKPVFVPLSRRDDQNTSGCRALLDEGALPLPSFVDQLASQLPTDWRVQRIMADDEQVLNYLSVASATPEELTKALNVHYTLVLRSLARLESMGFVQRACCGRWYRKGLRMNGEKAWWRSRSEGGHLANEETDFN